MQHLAYNKLIPTYKPLALKKHKKLFFFPLEIKYSLTNNKKFDRGLVQQFIKYLGIHPVGSLVKLSDEKSIVKIFSNYHHADIAEI